MGLSVPASISPTFLKMRKTAVKQSATQQAKRTKNAVEVVVDLEVVVDVVGVVDVVDVGVVVDLEVVVVLAAGVDWEDVVDLEGLGMD